MSVQVSSAGTDDSKNDAEDKECKQVGSAGTDDSKNDTEDYEGTVSDRDSLYG
ncbi:hypothetical protein T08_16138 [Trichinella sp. T8]|nr:hypothetical protein T08_16138 [Trichinella sp. T8]